jgi:DNA-binding transcriptional LysR family regulator
MVAIPERHRLARLTEVDFSALLDEPVLALPKSAGPLRDYWLAIDYRNGRAPVIGAEIASADETYEALVDGRGVCLLSSGNVSLVERGGVVTRSVKGIPPSQLALAWRKDHDHPLVQAYVECARQTVI